MSRAVNWLGGNWSDFAIPGAVFALALIALFWLRRMALDALGRWVQETRWQGDKILLQATRLPSFLWCLLISAYLALQVSPLPVDWEEPSRHGLLTLLLLSLTLTALNLAARLIPSYGEKLGAPHHATALVRNMTFIATLVVAGLMLLDIWGAPTSPLLLAIGAAVLLAALALRDTLPNLFAGFQISATQHIKEGDYIKLETGEEGEVVEIDWRYTRIRGLDESLILIPNRKLAHTTVVNYGRPLKKAREPLRFHSRVLLKELTGLKARNLRELLEVLKEAPDSVVYYHTHHFLEDHHYLTPEPASDFALWVSDALGDEVLGEKLASVDAFEFPTLGALRERLVGVIEEHLSRDGDLGDVQEGREFHFIKSVSVILPTPYVAHDLREFVEALRRLSLGSLYYHVFESRLRLGRGQNDMSIWLEDSLDETELGERIARLDPYSYTLEGLRSLLIQLIEKRIK